MNDRIKRQMAMHSLRLLLILCWLKVCRGGYDCIPKCTCEYHEYLLADCSNANYTVIPQPDFHYPLQALYLQNNEVKSLRDGEFLRFSHLRDLYLHGNKIHKIEDGAFDGLERLQKLDLSRNGLSVIPSNELAKLASGLVFLSIAGNAFTDLPSEISSLSKMEYLDFSDNVEISHIPTGALPHNLKELYMSNTAVRQMETAMLKDQKSLTVLEFSNCHQVQPLNFEANFFDGLVSLKHVDLSECVLSGVPRNAFVQLARLENLLLSGCGLESFPELYWEEDGSGDSHAPYLPNINDTTMTDATNNDPKINWYNGKLTVLDLSNNPNVTIDSANTLFPPLLTDLRLGYTNIARLSKELFKGVTKIESLDLQFCNISSIALDALANMQNLSEIWLTGNPIEDVPQLPSSITKLDLQETGIKRLTKERFTDSLYVVEANFSSSQIESVRDFTFGHMTSLRILDLSFNKFTSLSMDSLAIGVFHSPHGEAADTSHLTSSLSHLILSHGVISRVEKRAFQSHGRLKRLDLQMNYLTALEQDTFKGLDLLEELNLNHNLIKDMEPQAFEGLGKLEVLLLSSNRLEVIFSQTFNNMVSLRRLHLENNNILIFHAISIPSLEYVDFSNNRLTGFPEVHGENVQTIDVSRNPIVSIKPSVLRNLKNLRSLNISFCRLKDVRGAFTDLPALTTLDLTGNKIRNFLNTRLPSLKTLYLGDNGIESLNLIRYLQNITPNIETLDLRRNLIKRVDARFFYGVSSLKVLNLTGNKLACDCDLAPLVELIRNSTLMEGHVDKFTCGDPPESIDRIFNEELNCYNHEEAGISKATMYIVICIALFIVALLLLFLVCRLSRRLRKRGANNAVGLGGGVTMIQAKEGNPCCCFACSPSMRRERVVSEESRDLVEHVTSPVDKEAPIPL